MIPAAPGRADPCRSSQSRVPFGLGVIALAQALKLGLEDSLLGLDGLEPPGVYVAGALLAFESVDNCLKLRAGLVSVDHRSTSPV